MRDFSVELVQPPDDKTLCTCRSEIRTFRSAVLCKSVSGFGFQIAPVMTMELPLLSLCEGGPWALLVFGSASHSTFVPNKTRELIDEMGDRPRAAFRRESTSTRR